MAINAVIEVVLELLGAVAELAHAEKKVKPGKRRPDPPADPPAS